MSDFILRVFDCETTGLDPAIDRIVEVATVDLIVRDGDVLRGESWSTLINPGMPIPCQASAIHGIVDEMVADAPPFDEAMATHIKRGPPTAFCAHNSRFDQGFFKPANIPWLDTYRLALWIWPECPSHSNQCLRYFLKLKFADDPPPAHRALPDAIITAAILRRAITVLTAGADSPSFDERFKQMMEVSNEPAVLPRFIFGKWAMRSIAEIDVGYLEWMVQQKDMDADAKHTAFIELARRRNMK